MGGNCDSVFEVLPFLLHRAGLNIFVGGPVCRYMQKFRLFLAKCFHIPLFNYSTDIILGEMQGGDARTLYESVHSQVRPWVPMRQAGRGVSPAAAEAAQGGPHGNRYSHCQLTLFCTRPTTTTAEW